MDAIRTPEQREGPVPTELVHEWHDSDRPLTACGLAIQDLRMASDDGQTTCPECLRVLAGELEGERARNMSAWWLDFLADHHRRRTARQSGS